ncbi:MAG: glycogen synthase GlgA [Chloroflexi bacterium]|nr:MAG: glycogen synthase GlgA [Chloroflexota bacterium]
MIASECVPYVKTGGLADVVGALPEALHTLGHDVIVVIPKYASIDYSRHKLRPYFTTMGVWMGNTQEWCSIHMAVNGTIPVYFIEMEKYFDRWGPFHDSDLNDYLDNPHRFGFLTRAGLQLCKDIGFVPDIVHVHDWHTALGSAYLKIWHWNDAVLGRAASLLTIHNLAYQGVYPADVIDYLGLQWGNFTQDKFEDHGKINLLKGGIVYSDMVNTVSPTYAIETRTPEGGYGLAPFLNDKGDNYIGILNGVDYSQWNPVTDKLIPARYTPDDLSGKAICKVELQSRFLLDPDPNIPIIGVVSRLAAQKGLDLLAQVIEQIVNSMQVQFVILGSGDKRLEWFYGGLPARLPGKIGCFIGYNDELAHLIEAGSDFLIMPSNYEPCGLNQMYSLKYGTLPIVRSIGGLEDTVQQYNEGSGTGTGFKFHAANANAIFYTVGWAVSTYYDRPQHIRNMIKSAMAQDFSWDRSARQYVEAYRRAIRNKTEIL